MPSIFHRLATVNESTHWIRASLSERPEPRPATDALKLAGCHDIYEESASGKSADRPQLVECLRRLRRGDTLVVWKLDRLGHSLSDLVQIADRLRTEGVFIELLQPRVVFDDSTMGKAMHAMFGMFTEMERDLIRERTRARSTAVRGRAGRHDSSKMVSGKPGAIQQPS
ncbi:recombinase family protein [Paraburkholderia sp. RL17-373-BIF-A]|uniref:recombinase family protein n=1 Tax=Paraburkholderia sp. RL17-373-BIF-A TaxID=3031629 RepID=UPI0038B74843